MVLDFQISDHVVAMEKVAKQCVSTKCSIYATVFKFFFPLWTVMKSQKVGFTHSAIGIDYQVTHHVVAKGKLAEQHTKNVSIVYMLLLQLFTILTTVSTKET